MKYEDFLRAKVAQAPSFGFHIEISEINPILKDHNKAMVQWMVEGGRRGCFAAFGLAKTVTQIEAVRLTREHAGGMGLIIVPLGVRQEFMRDVRMLATGIHPNITNEQRRELKAWQKGRPDRVPRLKFVRSLEECDDPDGIYLTNYQTVRDGKLDPRNFSTCSLDEASCLRGFGGTKTFREFMRLFTGDAGPKGDRRGVVGVPYRFVATATPSPNEYIELLAYSAYLGIMDVSAAKTRFFKRNSEKADQLTIHPHKEREFWLWVATWGLFVQKPSDLGFSDEGYNLPELDIRWHEIPTDHSRAGFDKSGQGRLMTDACLDIQSSAKEKRLSLDGRVDQIRLLVRRHLSGDHGRPEESSKERTLEGMVREKQSERAGEAESTEQGELPSQQRGLQSQVEEVEGRKPGKDEGVAAIPPGEESRPNPRTGKGLVPQDQRGKESPIQGPQVEEAVRNFNGDLQPDVAGPGRELCHLRDVPTCSREGEPSRGSLPCDGKGQGTSLSPLQCGTGSIQGPARPAVSGRSVPLQIVIWCDLNDEQKAIEKMLDAEGVSYSSLTGSQSQEERERLLDMWRNKETVVFLSKPTMYGAGVNLQQAHIMIFAGIGFKFQDIFQGIHRVHRFLQLYQCIIHFIYTEAERSIRRNFLKKWKQHKEMMSKMAEIIKEYGLSVGAMAAHLTRAMGVKDRIEIVGDRYRLVNDDCVLETRRMADNSVHLVMTSIPFSTQYEYSPNYADMGHTDNNDHFFQHMDFLIPELFRVLQPGRLAAIHVKDRITPSGLTGMGFQTNYRFADKTCDHFEKAGFGFLGRKTIVTDVVRENAQTYRLGWTEQCKDGSRMGFGMPEYLLLFRKPPTDTSNGYADLPVVKDKGKYTRSRWQMDAHGFTRSSGDRPLMPEDLEGLTHSQIFQAFKKYSLEQIFDFEQVVRIAESLELKGRLPSDFMLLQPQSWSEEVWTDITRMRTLNQAQSAKGREMHLCPLQFDIVDRAINQWTNPGEVVYDCFDGIGTVVQRAIMAGRIGWGTELSTPYFLDSAAYAKAAEDEIMMPSLFSVLEMEGKDAA